MCVVSRMCCLVIFISESKYIDLQYSSQLIKLSTNHSKMLQIVFSSSIISNFRSYCGCKIVLQKLTSVCRALVSMVHVVMISTVMCVTVFKVGLELHVIQVCAINQSCLGWVINWNMPELAMCY